MGYLWSFLSDRSVRLIRSDKSDDFIFWTPKLNIPVLEKKKKKKRPFSSCVGCNWYFFGLLPELMYLRITFLMLTPFSELTASVLSPYGLIQNQHKGIKYL